MSCMSNSLHHFSEIFRFPLMPKNEGSKFDFLVEG